MPRDGRAAAVVVPAPFAGRDLARLWRRGSATSTLWIDAAIGGLPGYRPLLDPPGPDLDGWMIDEVLAPSSPLLDAAEAALGAALAPRTSGVFVTLLRALARGERTYTGLARASGLPAGALSRPLAALERAGLVNRVPDVLRNRRDLYDLADPHLRMWLSVIEPNRSALQAGRSREVWRSVRTTAWPSQVLGPRWESVVREWVAGSAAAGSPQRVGWTALSDRAGRTVHELDVVGVSGSEVVAIGEAKLRRLGPADLDRLRALRDRLGAPDARLVMASASAVEIPEDATDVLRLTPETIYGR
ncbi:MAG: ArsR family transcriptional regulator [Ilumatobacteraceae bacterium]